MNDRCLWPAMATPGPWYRSRRGLAVLLVYAGLTLLATLLSTGVWFDAVGLVGADGPATAVPGFVYLYAFLGAMAYALTSLIAKLETGGRGVARVGLRAVAALPLAAGVYLLAGPLGLAGLGDRAIAGVAFLVGLYVNLTLKALGGLAERLYGRRESGEPTGRSPSEESTSGGDSRG